MVGKKPYTDAGRNKASQRTTRKKKPLDPERVRKLYLDKGWRQQRIALHLGISKAAVGAALKQLGVPPQPRTILSDPAKRAAVNAKIKKLYVEKGWAQHQIAEHLGVSKWSITNRIRQLNLPVRPASIFYDKAKRPAVIKEVKHLYLRQGISLTEIARRIHSTRSKVAEVLKSEGIDVPATKKRESAAAKARKGEKIRRLYIEKHWSRNRIALHLGISAWSVDAHLTRLGMPLKRNILGDPKKRAGLLEKAKHLYINQELTIADAARKVGLDAKKVSEFLRRDGLSVKRKRKLEETRKREIREILHLYLDLGWTAERIGERFGRTTKAIFHVIFNAGESRRSHRPPLDRAKIKEMYVDQDITVKAIAEHFRDGHHAIDKVLDDEGIERGHQRTRKKRRSSHYDPRLENLDVGESFQVQVLDPYPAQVYFSRLAKQMNIRIATQRVGPTALRITRYA
jgi:DNA-binding transcriptional regulator LsrR (DeoR family)